MRNSPFFLPETLNDVMTSERIEWLFAKGLTEESTTEEHLELVQLLQVAEMNDQLVDLFERVNKEVEMAIPDERAEEIWNNICRKIRENTGECIG